jgi:hypothetical protein
MGISASKRCQDGSCLNKAGHYKQKFLDDTWKGTDREGYRYSVGYAPTGTAACRECKAKIAKGALRMGRATPNPFDAEAGSSDYTQFFHFEHAFTAFGRSRLTSKVPTTARSVSGASGLSPADRQRVDKAVVAFAAEWKRKQAAAKVAKSK